MAKYIDAEAAKRMAVETVVSTMPDVAELLEKAIDNIPAADVEPVRHGRWLINPDGYYPYCSECKQEPARCIMTNYCPNCGAKMDEGDEEK